MELVKLVVRITIVGGGSRNVQCCAYSTLAHNQCWMLDVGKNLDDKIKSMLSVSTLKKLEKYH